jgi:uncharacterized protein YPO0396
MQEDEKELLKTGAEAAFQRALSHAWTDDREQAEERFLILRGLVERLGSQESEQKRWRVLVLDVRQHVEFIGREVDAEGRQVEVYRGGSGKSGGQGQKLATTCLAAALRGHGRRSLLLLNSGATENANGDVGLAGCF